jgi:hypothetical protein
LLPRPQPSTVEPTWQLTTNNKGTPWQKCTKTKILEALPAGSVIWSNELKTARDYWVEFEYGTMGKPALQPLEDKHGSKWRSDKLISNVTGQNSTGMKIMWSQRTPIYNWMPQQAPTPGGNCGGAESRTLRVPSCCGLWEWKQKMDLFMWCHNGQ